MFGQCDKQACTGGVRGAPFAGTKPRHLAQEMNAELDRKFVDPPGSRFSHRTSEARDKSAGGDFVSNQRRLSAKRVLPFWTALSRAPKAPSNRSSVSTKPALPSWACPAPWPQMFALVQLSLTSLPAAPRFARDPRRPGTNIEGAWPVSQPAARSRLRSTCQSRRVTAEPLLDFGTPWPPLLSMLAACFRKLPH
jgi:hypothetical protein